LRKAAGGEGDGCYGKPREVDGDIVGCETPVQTRDEGLGQWLESCVGGGDKYPEADWAFHRRERKGKGSQRVTNVLEREKKTIPL
jgi:hypothetical protein